MTHGEMGCLPLFPGEKQGDDPRSHYQQSQVTQWKGHQGRRISRNNSVLCPWGGTEHFTESSQCPGFQRKHTHPGHQHHIVKPKGQFKETHTPPSRLGGWGDGQMNQVLGVNTTYQTANKNMSSLSICEFRQKLLTLQILFSNFLNFFFYC